MLPKSAQRPACGGDDNTSRVCDFRTKARRPGRVILFERKWVSFGERRRPEDTLKTALVVVFAGAPQESLSTPTEIHLSVRYPGCLGEPTNMGCGSAGIKPAEDPDARKVVCVKFQREMAGLKEVPFEGHPLGQRIYDSVSLEAWKMWLEHLKMLMNEYRLNLGTAEAQEFVIKQMEQYFFGEGSALPAGYQPQKAK